MLERADATKFIKSYFQKRNKAIANQLNDIDCQYLMTSFCWAARLIDNGCSIPGMETRIENHALAVIEKYGKPVDRTAIRQSSDKEETFISDIEDMIDSGEVKVYDYITTKSLSKSNLQTIIDYYTPILEELVSVKGTKDIQLKEGYRNQNTKTIGVLVAIYQSIIDDCQKVIHNKKIVRKPRAKKTISMEKRIEKVQYLPKFDPYQIVSIAPSAIIGSSEVWLYNVRYKTITRLVSDEKLDIKGTTVINYNESLSIKKTTGRKSKTIVETVVKAGKVKLKKIMDSIDGITSEATGRINKDTLILRVN